MVEQVMSLLRFPTLVVRHVEKDIRSVKLLEETRRAIINESEVITVMASSPAGAQEAFRPAVCQRNIPPKIRRGQVGAVIGKYHVGKLKRLASRITNAEEEAWDLDRLLRLQPEVTDQARRATRSESW
ncbi:hypothetical protein N7528_008217 [Penicillium herquei]|nr:hypothetical protein N7528_008217 [Penicillium herquei]